MTSKSSSMGQSSSVRSPAGLKKITGVHSSKHAGVGRNSSLLKGSGKPRMHPGMMSIQDRTTAHYGSVIGLKATSDGMYLLSAGII